MTAFLQQISLLRASKKYCCSEPTYDVLALRAEIAVVRGKFQVACETYEQLAQQTECKSQAEHADALNGLGYALGRMGRYEEAHRKLREVLVLLGPHSISLSLAEALGDLGEILMELGNFQEAKECLQRNLGLCQQLGNLIGEGVAESLIGELCRRENDLEEAERRLRRALEIARWVSNRWREAWVLRRMGILMKERGRGTEAEEYLRDADALLERIGAVD